MQFIINASVTPTHILFASVTMQHLPLPKLRCENEILYEHPPAEEAKDVTVNNPLPPSKLKSHHDQLYRGQ